jgi:hypothetical protein
MQAEQLQVILDRRSGGINSSSSDCALSANNARREPQWGFET